LALQSIRYRLFDASCHHLASSSRGICFAFRVFGPSWYCPYGSGDPALLLALASAVRFFHDGRPRIVVQAIRLILSSRWAFLQSLVQSHLADRSQPVRSSHGLLFPSARAGFEGPLVVRVPHALPFRLQGLFTLLTVCSLRSLAGSLSHRQRSWDLPFGVILPVGCRHVSARRRPRTVSPAVVPDATVRPARQAAVSGRLPVRKFLARGCGISTSAAGDSLVFPFQGVQPRPGPGFRPVSSHALFSALSDGSGRAAPQSVDRSLPGASACYRLAAGGDRQRARRSRRRAALLGFSHRRGPGIRAHIEPGYGFTSRPGRCCHRSADVL